MSGYLGHEAAYRGVQFLDKRKVIDLRFMGVGALGSWLADVLARQGYENMTLLDRERVESENFGTQNYGKSDVSRSKAIQCSHGIMRRLGVKSTPIHKQLSNMNAHTLVKGADLVVDLFDNIESRALVKQNCESLNIPCLHGGLSSTGFAEVKWNDDYIIIDKIDTTPAITTPCDYPMASNLVHFTVSILAEVINKYVDENIKEYVEFTLKDMNVDIRRRENVKTQSGDSS